VARKAKSKSKKKKHAAARSVKRRPAKKR